MISVGWQINIQRALIWLLPSLLFGVMFYCERFGVDFTDEVFYLAMAHNASGWWRYRHFPEDPLVALAQPDSYRSVIVRNEYEICLHR